MHVLCKKQISVNLQRGEYVEVALAEKNLEGYPSSLLFDSVSANQNEAATLDKSRMAKLLESKEVQTEVVKAALKHSAQVRFPSTHTTVV